MALCVLHAQSLGCRLEKAVSHSDYCRKQHGGIWDLLWRHKWPLPLNDTMQVEISRFSRVFVRTIKCFRDDDQGGTHHLDNSKFSESALGTRMEIVYSPWAVSMMRGSGISNKNHMKENVGGPTGGGGKGDGGDDGDGGGGNGDEDGHEHISLMPVLTLAFAVMHVGYCVVSWLRDGGLDFDFFRTGFGLFGLLAVSVFRMRCQAGADAYILGLCASIGVFVWTAERCYAKREYSPSGVLALFSAAMSFLFTTALYHVV